MENEYIRWDVITYPMTSGKIGPAGFGIAALLGAFVFSVAWIIAVCGDAGWVLGENTVSDLGVSDVQLSADVFKYASIITGLLFFVFGIGKAVFEKDANRASGIMAIIAALALIGIGTYSKDFGNGNAHLFSAVVFFLFIAASAALSGYGDHRQRKTIPAAITVVLFTASLLALATCSFELAEVVIIACVMIWAAVQGIKLAMSNA